ncbi:hypothetical protein H2248_003785 [Termitomyces sp. 'cryptogamus']|nr:hypothetical protein H2248_003785 [Termitomyces sp. 'cryptogamus']
MVNYLKHNPRAPRLLLANDVANGLLYLHENGIVHGELKGKNILINDTNQACLAGFGVLAQDPFDLSQDFFLFHWQAPELLDSKDTDPKNSMLSDVYAYGSVCYEVYSFVHS